MTTDLVRKLREAATDVNRCRLHELENLLEEAAETIQALRNLLEVYGPEDEQRPENETIH